MRSRTIRTNMSRSGHGHRAERAIVTSRQSSLNALSAASSGGLIPRMHPLPVKQHLHFVAEAHNGFHLAFKWKSRSIGATQSSGLVERGAWSKRLQPSAAHCPPRCWRGLQCSKADSRWLISRVMWTPRIWDLFSAGKPLGLFRPNSSAFSDRFEALVKKRGRRSLAVAFGVDRSSWRKWKASFTRALGLDADLFA